MLHRPIETAALTGKVDSGTQGTDTATNRARKNDGPREENSQSAATGEIPAVELPFALNGRNADSGTLAETIFSKDGFGVNSQEVNPIVFD